MINFVNGKKIVNIYWQVYIYIHITYTHPHTLLSGSLSMNGPFLTVQVFNIDI